MSFSDNLHHLRSIRNMTQEQLAMLMGVSRQAISKWESGRTYPEMDKLVRLSDIFECDLNELVRGDLTGVPVQRELAVPMASRAVDVCGYDRHMRVHAFMVASAVAIPALSLAVLFGTSPMSHFVGGERAFLSLSSRLLECCPFGLPVLVVGVLTGIALMAVALYRDMGFRGRFPCIEDFYTDEQRSGARKLMRRARVFAACAAIIGIIACAVKSTMLCHVNGGLCSLCAWGSAALWPLIYTKLMVRGMDIGRYNERNREKSEQRAAVRVVAELTATYAVVAANPEMPQLAQTWIRKRTFVLSGAILVGFALVGAVFAALDWCIFFIPLMVGAVLACLVWLMRPCVQ